MNESIVFLNGEFVPSHLAKVSVFDRGFLYGDGLFETMRAYNGKIFRLDAHLKRLLKSLDIIHIKCSYAQFQLEEALYETMKRNKLTDAYVRLTVTRGTGGKGLNPHDNCNPTIVIVAKRFNMYTPEQYEKGFKVMVSNFRQNQFSPIVSLKSMNFLDNIFARLEAKQGGVDEVIFLNQSGFVTEGSVSNIFMVSNDAIMTPSCETGILPGITREVVFELAENLGFKISEKNFYLKELFSCSECFLTNSLIEIMPITRIEDKRLAKGEITNQLMNTYRNLVQRENIVT